MNRYQLNVVEMAGVVSAYLGENIALWQTNKAVSDTVQEVNEILAAIAGTETKQKAPTVGPAADKATVRFNFENEILLIANQIAALAARNEDATLEAQADLTLARLDKLAADDLEATASRISALATENLAALADYKITQATLTNLASLQASFHAIKTKPRAAVVDRKKETEMLPPLISNLTTILRRRLDRQMITFKQTNPEFYAGYLGSRVIVDRGEPAKPKPTPAPAPQPPAP